MKIFSKTASSYSNSDFISKKIFENKIIIFFKFFAFNIVK